MLGICDNVVGRQWSSLIFLPGPPQVFAQLSLSPWDIVNDRCCVQLISPALRNAQLRQDEDGVLIQAWVLLEPTPDARPQLS